MIGGCPRSVKRALWRRAVARRCAVGLVSGVRQARARPLPAVPARRERRDRRQRGSRRRRAGDAAGAGRGGTARRRPQRRRL